MQKKFETVKIIKKPDPRKQEIIQMCNKFKKLNDVIKFNLGILLRNKETFKRSLIIENRFKSN